MTLVEDRTSSKAHETPSDKVTPYDQFNFDLPMDFPAQGIAARAAEAIAISEAWTDANPAMNLSSFVRTYLEPEAAEVTRRNILKNYIDLDMYPQMFARHGDREIVRSLHAGRARPQVELAPAAPESR